MTQAAKKEFTFTGRHMLLVMVAFFGTIITVNMVMAYFATSTWSGLVVQNTYVASQQFNGKAAAIREMLASGIKGETVVEGDRIAYRLTMPGDVPVLADRVTAHFKRPVGDHQDFVVTLTPAGNGLYVAEHQVLAGDWIVETIAVKDGSTVMHEAVRLSIGGGRK